MNITERLAKWKRENNGVVETTATISIRNENMNITVQGTSLEDAYEKLAKLYGETAENGNVQEVKSESVQPAHFPATSTLSAPTENTKSIQDVLNGKQLVRIYTPGSNLGFGESVVNYNNVQYVVK